MSIGAMTTVDPTSQQRDTSSHVSPLLALTPIAAPTFPPPTPEECLAFKREIDDFNTISRTVHKTANQHIRMTASGATFTMVGGAAVAYLGITRFFPLLQKGFDHFRKENIGPSEVLNGGCFIALSSALAFVTWKSIHITDALFTQFKPDLIPYLRAEWLYHAHRCDRIIANATIDAKQAVVDSAPDSKTERIEIESSDAIPTTINTPFEYPPMPSPWKVAAAHMMRDVGQSLQDTGKEMGDAIVPIALTGAAIVVGIAALETGNTAPLQRVFGF